MHKLSFTYPSKEKLKSKRLINLIFGTGNTLKAYPILIRYVQNEKRQVGVSVSKRNFKKAVDRIRIKRQLREAYRLNKHEINAEQSEFAVMIIFMGRYFTKSNEVHQKVRKLLKEIK